MRTTRRARSAEQKDERRQQVLDAARALFERSRFHTVSIAAVARKAHLAKGTVFLYFHSKEEVFFAIACQEFEHWLDDMDQLFRRLAQVTPKPGRGAVLKELAVVLRHHNLLRRLIAILHSVIEHNVRYPEVLRYKRMMGARLPATGALIEQALPFFKPGQGVKLLLWMYALVIGFAHLAEPPATVEKVYRSEADLRWMQLDFGAAYFDALGTILDGWQQQGSAGAGRAATEGKP